MYRYVREYNPPKELYCCQGGGTSSSWDWEAGIADSGEAWCVEPASALIAWPEAEAYCRELDRVWAGELGGPVGGGGGAQSLEVGASGGGAQLLEVGASGGGMGGGSTASAASPPTCWLLPAQGIWSSMMKSIQGQVCQKRVATSIACQHVLLEMQLWRKQA